MYTDSVGTSGLSSIFIIMLVIYAAVLLLMLVSQWILFSKAGKPGWACIIPIFNLYTILKIGGKPGYWIVLMMIPVVNIVIAIMTLQAFLKAYGRGSAGSVLLAMFFGIFYYPYLAFSKNVKYVGA